MHFVIPAAAAIPFPKHLDPALAAGVLVQGLTAYLVLDQAQVKNGDVVLIAAAAGALEALPCNSRKSEARRLPALLPNRSSIW